MFEIVHIGPPTEYETLGPNGEWVPETRVQVVFEGGRKLTPPNSYMAARWFSAAEAATFKVGDEYDLAQHAPSSVPPAPIRDELLDIEAEVYQVPLDDAGVAAVQKLLACAHGLRRQVQQLQSDARRTKRAERKRIASEKLRSFLDVKRIPSELLEAIVERQGYTRQVRGYAEFSGTGYGARG